MDKQVTHCVGQSPVWGREHFTEGPPIFHKRPFKIQGQILSLVWYADKNTKKKIIWQLNVTHQIVCPMFDVLHL